jgi:hypothetical protein
MATLPFEPCSSMCISGMTGTGKTRWLYQVLKQLKGMYKDPPVHTLYCYGIYQPLFDEMERELPHFTAKRGLPTTEELEEYTKDRQHKLIVLDDLMHQVVQHKDMELLFTQGTHHRRVSVILITQNLFPKGKHARTIALNTWYLVLMKNLRDISQVGILGRQLYPGKVNGFMKAYQDALTYGYFIVDMSPHAEDQYRLRTRILPGEDPLIYRLT